MTSRASTSSPGRLGSTPRSSRCCAAIPASIPDPVRAVLAPRGDPVSAGDDEQLYARVAWLYHKEDRTQGEIADILGLTRLRVNRILAECRASGLVRISLSTRFESCVALERRLFEEHGLSDAVIIPTPLDPDQTHALVGQAAGDFLTRSLRRSPASRIGV